MMGDPRLETPATSDDGIMGDASGDDRGEAVGDRPLAFMRLIADATSGSIASLDRSGSRSSNTPPSPSALSPTTNSPPPPPMEESSGRLANRETSSSASDSNGPADSGQQQINADSSPVQGRVAQKAGGGGGAGTDLRRRRQQRRVSSAERTATSLDPAPAERTPESKPRKSRRRSTHRKGSSNGHLAAAVLTHDEMLAAKLKELHDIVNMDVSEISEFLRHGPSVGKPPLPGRRGGRGASSKPRRRSASGKRPEMSPPGAKHAATEAQSATHARTSSAKRHVMFSVPAIDVSRTGGLSRDEESAPSGSPSSADGQSPSDSSPTGDSSSSSSGSRFPKPHGTRSSENAGQPRSRSLSSERCEDDEDRNSATASRRRSSRSAERTLARDSDLRHAASADVRRWLRRKESSIRKAKRDKRAEERQKKREAEAAARAQQERQRLAQEAMRAWMKTKTRTSAEAAGAPRADRSARRASKERSESCADGCAADPAGDSPTATAAGLAAEASVKPSSEPTAAVPPAVSALKTPAASGTTSQPPPAGATANASKREKPAAPPGFGSSRARRTSEAAAAGGGGAGKTQVGKESTKNSPLSDRGTGAQRNPSPRRGRAASATPPRPKVESKAAATGSTPAPKAARSNIGDQTQDDARPTASAAASARAQPRRERTQSVPAAAAAATTSNGSGAHSTATIGVGSTGQTTAAETRKRDGHSGQRVAEGGHQRRPPRDHQSSAAGDRAATAPEMSSNSPDIKEPPKTAAGRKSYDEWLRSKILNRSSTSDSGLPTSGSRTGDASASDGLPAEVIRDAARRRLEKIRRGRSPQQAAREAASPGAEAAGAGQPPASAGPPATNRRPFRWKAATGVLLEPSLGATRNAPDQPATSSDATSAADGPSGATPTHRRASATTTRDLRRQADSGSAGETVESPTDNPFRVPFPKMRRPRSSLERASFRGPEFASFVHKLVAEDFRPEPQGSETPEPVVENAATTTKTRATDYRREQAESKAPAPAATAAAPQRCASPATPGAARSPPSPIATSELSVLDSDDIFALTSVQTQ